MWNFFFLSAQDVSLTKKSSDWGEKWVTLDDISSDADQMGIENVMFFYTCWVNHNNTNESLLSTGRKIERNVCHFKKSICSAGREIP